MARIAECFVVAPVFSVTQHSRRGYLEDTAGASWKYIDPQGKLVDRLVFINMGADLGFRYGDG